MTPPQVLPQGSWWEKAFARWLPASAGEQAGPVLRGIGASAGQVTGTARVLAGPADFARLQPGDVLVASITTPAWTTLFAMASAVVTDVGGPLSHSSIVAREYGIPAVLGTNVATRRIPDGARVRVDGEAGTVTLLDEQGDERHGQWRGRRHRSPSGPVDRPPRRRGARAGRRSRGGCRLVAAPGGQEVTPVRPTAPAARTRPRAPARG